ncbi:MAG: helix-turn-helix domain-containing protein [Pseudonocardiales bacterium]|nr:helix-turn-helix domain-containing protein [Pseudonocardiales bacterium]
MGVDEGRSIGARARMIRRRRGLSLEVVGGLAGITKQYLSQMERGLRGFNRRGLIENLAEALGCSVADLTGQPYLPPDRATADALAVIAEITPLLYDISLDHVPDVPTRPVDQLAAWAAQANAHCEQARYALAGRDLDALLTELYVHAATGTPAVRRTALTALVEACVVAFGIAHALGNPQLAVQAMDRGLAAAVRLGDPALAGFAGLARAGGFSCLGARRTASAVLAEVRAIVEPEADPTGEDVRAAEALGLTHVLAARLAIGDGRPGDAETHLAEAADLAHATGERNTLQWHFGPANVAAWSLTIAVEQGNGPSHAERLEVHPITPMSAGRGGRLHLDLARGYAQSEGARDAEAIRHLDTADRIAPTRIRNDPLARDLLLTLERRARRRAWELDSLRNRFGVSRSAKT